MTRRRDTNKSTSEARRRGVTLVELVLALIILSLVAVACQSVVRLAAKGTSPTGMGPRTLSASTAVDAIASDARFATAVGTATATELVLTLPDQDGNGSADAVRYAWSGTSGTPLTRQYVRTASPAPNWNTVTATAIADDVRDLTLAYDRRVVETVGSTSEGAETLLVNYDPLVSLADRQITSTNRIGEYFKPNFASDVTAWRVTRVRFKAKYVNLPTGSTKIQLRTASSGLPTSTVLEERTMSEVTLLLSYGWQTATYTNVSGLSPSAGLCLVMEYVSGTESCAIQYQTAGSTLATGTALMSSNGGGTWTSSATQDLPIQVYGKLTSVGPSTFEYFLTGVRATISSGDDPASRVSAAARVYNEPSVSAP